MVIIFIDFTFEFPLQQSSTTSTGSYPIYPAALTEAGKKYFVTVVAVNTALLESRPICTDGVVIDYTPPLISGIDIEGAMVTPGLIQEAGSSNIWFVNAQRKRCEIVNPAEQCQ